MADNLITKTDAKWRYGATEKDLAGLNPAKSYYHRRNRCQVTLFSVEAVEAYLVKRYGALDTCAELAKGRRAAAQIHADRRLVAEQALAITPPDGWPNVGRLRGSERWAAVDTETTGLDLKDGCRVVEVAAIIVEAGVVVHEWTTRINPGPATTWTDGAIEVTGITPASVAKAPAAADVWREFSELTSGLPLAAHNAGFDSRFIQKELLLAGMSPEWASWHCTMVAATKRGGRWPQLGDLYWQHARRYVVGAHSALGDARAVAWLAPRVIS